MKLCKEAMDNATACGKNCCCLECDRRESCSEVCGELSENCEFAFESDTSLVEMQKNAAAIISSIAALAVQKKRIEEQEKAMRDKLREAMESYGVKSFETPEVKFLYIPATTRTTIDTARLKKAMPDVVEKYSKITNVSASVKITVK